jgi:hypothetical protein
VPDFESVRNFRAGPPGPTEFQVREARARLVAETGASRGRVARLRDPSPRRAFFIRVSVATVGLALFGAIGVALLGSGTGSPPPAYGAELIRFAQSTPLLLLEEPGWRVAYLNEDRRAPGKPLEGQMKFVTGSQQVLEAQMTGADVKRHVIPPDVLRSMHSRVNLSWKDTDQARLVWRGKKLGVSMYNAYYHKRVTYYERGRAFKTTIPGLGARAYVAVGNDEFRYGEGPRNHAMVALWTESGHLLELRASVPDLVSFEERLSWLTKVDSKTWLDAMPPKVIKAADRDHAVREMLKGIPLPATFKPSRVPVAGLATDRYQLGAAVTGTVSCLWFRQWGEARRSGDQAAENQAERAMATSKRWPILRQMAKNGGYPATIWQLAVSMPSGVWRRGPKRTVRLLPKAEGLGCARMGLRFCRGSNVASTNAAIKWPPRPPEGKQRSASVRPPGSGGHVTCRTGRRTRRTNSSGLQIGPSMPDAEGRAH